MRVADTLVRAGAQGADAADAIAAVAAARPPGGWMIERGGVDLRALRKAAAHLDVAAQGLARARAMISRSPSTWLIGSVSRQRTHALVDLSAAEQTAAQGVSGLRLASKLLGADGPRRYYLGFGSLSELRGTGGFMGFSGVLNADHGRLSLTALGRPYDRLPPVSPAAIRSPAWFIASYARFGATRDWRNLNAATDFPAVGRVITQVLRQPGSLGPIDGVIEIDPVALGPMLRSTGPLKIPLWPDAIDASNVSAITQFSAYARFGASAQRTDFLANVAEALFSRLTGGTMNLSADTLAGLGRAAHGGHIQMYATRPDEERALEELGLGRSVDRARSATDVLGVVTENWSPSKIDWFLRRRVTYDVRLDPHKPKQGVRSHLRVELINQAPESGLPDLILGPNPPNEVPRGHNRQLVILLRPPDDQLLGSATVDGKRRSVSADREAELRSHMAFVTVPPRARSVLEADFVVPGGVRGTGRHRVYRLHILRQPIAHPDEYKVNVHPPKGWKLEGRSTFNGPLLGDVVMDVHLKQTARAWLLDTAVLRPLRLARNILGI